MLCLTTSQIKQNKDFFDAHVYPNLNSAKQWQNEKLQRSNVNKHNMKQLKQKHKAMQEKQEKQKVLIEGFCVGQALPFSFF